MGFRFRRSVKIAPGVRLNFGKRGTSVSLGGRGVTTNLSKRGKRSTYSLRGTGLSYTTKTSKISGCGCALPVLSIVFICLKLALWFVNHVVIETSDSKKCRE